MHLTFIQINSHYNKSMSLVSQQWVTSTHLPSLYSLISGGTVESVTRVLYLA